MNTNPTDRLINNLYDLQDAPMPDPVVWQAKRCLLDYLGAAFAGAHMLDEKGRDLLGELGRGPADAAVIGFDTMADVHSTVFVNGLSSHVGELDDGVRFGMLHPGSPLLSALLPVAQKAGVGGGDLLRGIVVGYEAAVRLGRAMQPTHYKRGYHPTGTCGGAGAAVGIAAMLGLAKAQTKDAFCAAVVSAAGTLKVLEDDSELKPFNVARAAASGWMAVHMARAGFKGPEDALGGKAGLFTLMTDDWDESQLDRQEGEAWAVQQVYVKPYAACRHAHPSIEAILKIRAGGAVKVSDIERIRITTYDSVLGKHDHNEVHKTASAKMSIPYSTAVAMVTGDAGLDAFTRKNIDNPEIAALAAKVEIRTDDAFSALVPQKRVAVLEAITYDGRRVSERVDYPKGEPEVPLSDEELREKFVSLARYAGRPEEEIRETVEVVWNLERELPRLFRLL